MGKKNKKARAREASELTLPHLREALEEMVFQGGSLNLKLLGASQLVTEQ